MTVFPITYTNAFHEEAKILLAVPGDINSIIALNQKYLIQNIHFDKLLNGFIKVPYTNNQLTIIIKANEIAVAQVNDCLVGYYLIGSNCDNEFLTYQELAATRLAKSKSTTVTKIGFGVQVCIDEPYHNNGLFASLLKHLVKNIAHKYDYLFCSVSDENARSLEIHLKEGWRIFEKSLNSNFLYFSCNGN